jgi:chromosome segregation ATPase
MDPIVTVLLTTAAGALTGTIVGVLLMRRQLRPVITEEALAELRNSLQRSESSLTTATANAEGLAKQVAQREKSVQQANDDLKQKQQQLDRVLAEAQAETVKCAAAEKKAQELNTRADALTERCTKLDAKTADQEKQLAEKAAQLVSLQGDVDAGKRSAEELKGQVTRVTAERDELKSSSEQDARYRTSLEARLQSEQEQIGHLNTKIAELQEERTQLELRLHQERQSAVRGMELLVMAQEKLAGVFNLQGVDAQKVNGNGAAAAAPPEADAVPVTRAAVPAKSDS